MLQTSDSTLAFPSHVMLRYSRPYQGQSSPMISWMISRWSPSNPPATSWKKK